jgi:hypothetical protein
VPSVLFKTKETVVCETPAARAMSLLVMRPVIRGSFQGIAGKNSTHLFEKRVHLFVRGFEGGFDVCTLEKDGF